MHFALILLISMSSWASTLPGQTESIKIFKSSGKTRSLPKKSNLISLRQPTQTADEFPFYPSIEEFWRQTRCEDLFNWKPQNPIYAKNWLPLCSMTIVNYYRAANELELKMSSSEKWTNSYSKTKHLLSIADRCTKQTVSTSSPSSNTPLSQNQSGVIPVAKGTLMRIIAEADKIKLQYAEACCQKNDICKKTFIGTQIKWCLTKKESNVPDPCVSQGTYFNIEQAVFAKIIESLRQKKEPEFNGGYIQLSPLMSKETLEKKSSEKNIREELLVNFPHELGHACRMAIAQASASGEQDNDYFIEDIEKDLEAKTRCQVNESTVKSYERYFDLINVSKKSYKCILQIADGIKNGRFEDKGCSNESCPRRALDEAFAETFRYLSASLEDLRPLLSQRNCPGSRDFQHPFTADILFCLNESDYYKRKFSEALNCFQ